MIAVLLYNYAYVEIYIYGNILQTVDLPYMLALIKSILLRKILYAIKGKITR